MKKKLGLNELSLAFGVGSLLVLYRHKEIPPALPLSQICALLALVGVVTGVVSVAAWAQKRHTDKPSVAFIGIVASMIGLLLSTIQYQTTIFVPS